MKLRQLSVSLLCAVLLASVFACSGAPVKQSKAQRKDAPAKVAVAAEPLKLEPRAEKTDPTAINPLAGGERSPWAMQVQYSGPSEESPIKIESLYQRKTDKPVEEPAKPGIESFVSADALAFVSLDDMTSAKKVVERSILNKIWNDPVAGKGLKDAFQDMRSSPGSSGISLDEVLALTVVFRGQSVLAVYPFEPVSKKRFETTPIRGDDGKLIWDEDTEAFLMAEQEIEYKEYIPSFLFAGRVVAEKDKLEALLAKLVADPTIFGGPASEESYGDVSYTKTGATSFGFVGDIFFLGAGPTDAQVKSFIDCVSGAPSATPLTADGNFAKYMASAPKKKILSFYVNIDKFISNIITSELAKLDADSKTSDQKRKLLSDSGMMLEGLGLSGIKGVYGSVTPEGDGLLTEALVLCPEKKGLLAAIEKTQTTSFKALKAVPKDPSCAVAVSISADEAFLTWKRLMAEQLSSAQFSEFISALGVFESMAGVSLEKDLLPSIGDEFVVVFDKNSDPSMASLGALPGNMAVALVIGIKDRVQFAKVHTSIMNLLTATGAAGALKERTQNGITMRLYEMTVEGKQVEAGGYFYTDDVLVFAFTGNYLRKMADCVARKAPSAEADTDFSMLSGKTRLGSPKALQLAWNWGEYLSMSLALMDEGPRARKGDYGVEFIRQVIGSKGLKEALGRWKSMDQIYIVEEGFVWKQFNRILD